MKVLINTIGEKREIEGTDYSFIKNPCGYQLIRYGYNTPFATNISDFVSFENAGSNFLAFKNYDGEFFLYNFDRSRERFVKNLAIVPKVSSEFIVELELGNKEYYNLSLMNLSFEQKGRASDAVVKMRLKKGEYSNENFTIKLGEDLSLFVSLIEREDDKNIRYIL